MKILLQGCISKMFTTSSTGESVEPQELSIMADRDGSGREKSWAVFHETKHAVSHPVICQHCSLIFTHIHG